MAAEAPWEFLEMADGAVLELVVLRVETGVAFFTRRRDDAAREVPVLRLHVDPRTKATLPAYWDVGAQLLNATLGPMLTAEGALPRRVRLTKYGTGPAGRYGLVDLGRVAVA
jgi:hypothetical protein